MRLDSVTAEIRPRSDWEAVDLGFAMVRRDFWRCISLWWMALCVPVAVGWTFLNTHPIWLLVLFWWLKPVGSRIVLFQLSRRLFGEVPSWKSIWREIPSAFTRRFFYRFLWARLSPCCRWRWRSRTSRAVVARPISNAAGKWRGAARER